LKENTYFLSTLLKNFASHAKTYFCFLPSLKEIFDFFCYFQHSDLLFKHSFDAVYSHKWGIFDHYLKIPPSRVSKSLAFDQFFPNSWLMRKFWVILYKSGNLTTSVAFLYKVANVCLFLLIKMRFVVWNIKMPNLNAFIAKMYSDNVIPKISLEGFADIVPFDNLLILPSNVSNKKK
jgi:hypothetical protein